MSLLMSIWLLAIGYDFLVVFYCSVFRSCLNLFLIMILTGQDRVVKVKVGFEELMCTYIYIWLVFIYINIYMVQVYFRWITYVWRSKDLHRNEFVECFKFLLIWRLKLYYIFCEILFGFFSFLAFYVVYFYF